MTPRKLNGKVGIITGSDQGIGRSIVLSFCLSPERKAQMRKPDDIKRVAVFLASQGPMGITGESIDSSTWEKIYLNRNL